MIRQTNMLHRKRTWISCLCAMWLCASIATAADNPFLQNPSFEAVTSLKAPPKGNERGTWTLNDNLRVPAQWTLSSAFPGQLDVIEDDAADGRHFLHLAAGTERAAHVFQICPNLRRGLGYEVSVRYRGGPVELKVYEYDDAGKLKTDRPFAKGLPTPVRDGDWATLVGIYIVPTGIARVNLVLAVPVGGEADLDDVRISQFERSAKPLNVQDFGASGSEFETLADTAAGSNTITLQEIGDFQQGQQVAISRCNPHITDGRLWGRPQGVPQSDFSQQVQVRGYDAALGNWTVYVLDFEGTNPPTFRWSDDLALSWHDPVPINGQWQKLSDGVEVKLPDIDFWTRPAVVAFSGRDQLVTTILDTEGNTLTLADPTPLAAKECVVQHTDSGPLQAALDRAVAEGRNVFLPAGCYRLTEGLNLTGADGIAVEGENEERTILDISNGRGACLSIVGGTSITIRNLRFRGFSGFAERKQMGFMRVHGYAHMWGFYAKHCSALGIRSPERVLVENCHARGMSAECFYSSSRGRSANNDPEHYTKSIVYRNCTVIDCARNAFNNNDHAENTAVLYCRIENVGGCSWEGASRFVKIVGNYFRNAGTVAMGNIRSRDASLDILPSGQHIVAHNTFEQQMVYGGCAIRSSAGSTPVIISNNLFVNFNTSAIEATGFGDYRNLPAGNTIHHRQCDRSDVCPRRITLAFRYPHIGGRRDTQRQPDLRSRQDRSAGHRHCAGRTGAQHRGARQHYPRLRRRPAGHEDRGKSRPGDRCAHVQVQRPSAMASARHALLPRLPDCLDSRRRRRIRHRPGNRNLRSGRGCIPVKRRLRSEEGCDLRTSVATRAELEHPRQRSDQLCAAGEFRRIRRTDRRIGRQSVLARPDAGRRGRGGSPRRIQDRGQPVRRLRRTRLHASGAASRPHCLDDQLGVCSFGAVVDENAASSTIHPGPDIVPVSLLSRRVPPVARFAVILPAAGKSSRFKDPHYKKAFAPLDNRAVWMHSAEKFVNRDEVQQVILIIAAEDREWFNMKFAANAAVLGIDVVLGGAERTESVANALAHVKPDVDFIAIHDAARPCIAEEWIDRVFRAAEKSDAAHSGDPRTGHAETSRSRSHDHRDRAAIRALGGPDTAGPFVASCFWMPTRAEAIRSRRTMRNWSNGWAIR